MAHEKNAIVNQAPKPLDYKAKPTVYADEGRSQAAIEVQKPKGNFTNTVLVDEVKVISKDEIQKATGGKIGFDAVVVEELPQAGEKGIIYLIANNGETPNIYDEYIWIESSASFEKIGTTEVDLSGYLKNNADVVPATTNSYDLGSSTYKWKDLYLSGKNYYPSPISNKTNFAITNNGYNTFQIKAEYGGTEKEAFQFEVSTALNLAKFFVSSAIINADLGTQNGQWRDLYLSRNLSDGTNSVTVANISNGLFNVINASDIISNTLTQEQYDLITNGKPTLIKGTILGGDNLFIAPLKEWSGQNKFYAFTTYSDGYGRFFIKNFIVDASTKAISLTSQGMRIGYNGKIVVDAVENFNGKSVPSYPSDTGTFTLKCVDGVVTWVAD